MKQRETAKQTLLRKFQNNELAENKLRSEYRKIIEDNVKDRYHILRKKVDVLGDDNVRITSQIQVFTPQDWEDETDVSGGIIKRGMQDRVKHDASGSVAVLWNPRSDNKQTATKQEVVKQD